MCVCVLLSLCGPKCPDHHFLSSFVFPLSPSPTLQLPVKTDKPPACCHMELINRTGGNKRQFNFNTNKETFQIPPYKKPGGTRRTRSLRVFALKQIYGGPRSRAPSQLSLRGPARKNPRGPRMEPHRTETKQSRFGVLGQLNSLLT